MGGAGESAQRASWRPACSCATGSPAGDAYSVGTAPARWGRLLRIDNHDHVVPQCAAGQRATPALVSGSSTAGSDLDGQRSRRIHERRGVQLESLRMSEGKRMVWNPVAKEHDRVPLAEQRRPPTESSETGITVEVAGDALRHRTITVGEVIRCNAPPVQLPWVAQVRQAHNVVELRRAECEAIPILEEHRVRERVVAEILQALTDGMLRRFGEVPDRQSGNEWKIESSLARLSRKLLRRERRAGFCASLPRKNPPERPGHFLRVGSGFRCMDRRDHFAGLSMPNQI